MKFAIPKERRAGELRVAASPDTVKRFVGLGAEVSIETGAGDDSLDFAQAPAVFTTPAPGTASSCQ